MNNLIQQLNLWKNNWIYEKIFEWINGKKLISDRILHPFFWESSFWHSGFIRFEITKMPALINFFYVKWTHTTEILEIFFCYQGDHAKPDFWYHPEIIGVERRTKTAEISFRKSRETIPYKIWGSRRKEESPRRQPLIKPLLIDISQVSIPGSVLRRCSCICFDGLHPAYWFPPSFSSLSPENVR